MAHFAELNNNNMVTRVLKVSDEDTSDANGVEKEYIGQAFLEKMFGGKWVQTSYNSSFRNCFAAVGFFYNEEHDYFYPPKPDQYPSWVLDTATGYWVPPIPRPEEKLEPNHDYVWNEETQAWDVKEFQPGPEAP